MVGTWPRFAISAARILSWTVVVALGLVAYYAEQDSLAEMILLSICGGLAIFAAVALCWPDRPTRFSDSLSREAPATAAARSGRPTAAGIAGALAPTVAIVGIGVYSSTAVAYQRFYGALGVSTRDVGLDYNSVLSNSVGLVLALVIATGPAAAVYTAGTLAYWRWRRRRQTDPAGKSAGDWRVLREGIRVFAVFLLLSGVLAAKTLAHDAGREAMAVQRGHGVTSLGLSGTSLQVFPINAVVVSVELASDSGTPTTQGRPGPSTCPPALAALPHLSPDPVYLGQANGVDVFYVPGCGPVHVPSSVIRMIAVRWQ